MVNKLSIGIDKKEVNLQWLGEKQELPRVPACEKINAYCPKVYTDCQYVNTDFKAKKEVFALRRTL